MSYEGMSAGRVVPGNSDVLPVSYGDDSGLYVEFYMNSVFNEAKSAKEGRPIYEDKEYVRMQPTGDKTKVVDRPVRKTFSGNVPSDTARFPRQWQAFQNQEKVVTEGTPITEWPPITRSDAKMLKGLNIHTVEMLASLQENHLTFLGARQMRDKAKAWMEKAKDTSAATQFAAREAAMQAQIDGLQNQINGFRAAGVPIQEASAPPAPKKRGPKPKVRHEQNIPSTGSASG